MAKGTPGFFDVDERLAELSAKGDDLERVKTLVDFGEVSGGAGGGKSANFACAPTWLPLTHP